MYFIELMLTRKCNASCYYCTTQCEDKTEVDLDYLKWALDQCPENLGVDLTGGEIGLVYNLDEIYHTVKNHPHVKHITVQSNGLVRRRGFDWLDEVEYWEHLVFEIRGKQIIKFYNDLNLGGDHKYIIITTPTTTKSLLDYWKYHKDMGMFRDNFYYKLMNHKSPQGIMTYYEQLADLYTRLERPHERRMLLTKKLPRFLANEREFCMLVSPNPFIDIQRKELGHCAINVNRSLRYEFNKENLERIINGDVDTAFYCAECHSFDDGRSRGKYANRSYKR